MSALSSLLVQDHIVSVSMIEEALQRQVIFGGELDTNLLELRALEEQVIVRYKARITGLRPASLEEIHGAESEALKLVPREIAEKHLFVPLSSENNSIRVAVCRSPDEIDLDSAAKTLSVVLEPVMTSELRLRVALNQYYGVELPARFSRLAGLLASSPARKVQRRSSQPPEQAEGTPSESSASAEQQLQPADQMTEDELRDQKTVNDFQMFDGRGEQPVEQVGGVSLRDSFVGYQGAPAILPLPAGLQLIEDATTREEVFDAALRVIGGMVEYAAVFVVKGNIAHGKASWGQGTPGEELARRPVLLEKPGALWTVTEACAHYLGPLPPSRANDSLLEAIGRPRPSTILVVPVVLKERAIVLIYADSGGRGTSGYELAALLPLAKAMASTFERLILERKRGNVFSSAPPPAPQDYYSQGQQSYTPPGDIKYPSEVVPGLAEVPVQTQSPYSATDSYPPSDSYPPADYDQPSSIFGEEEPFVPPESGQKRPSDPNLRVRERRSSPPPMSGLYPPPTPEPGGRAGDGVLILLTEVLGDPQEKMWDSSQSRDGGQVGGEEQPAEVESEDQDSESHVVTPEEKIVVEQSAPDEGRDDDRVTIEDDPPEGLENLGLRPDSWRPPEVRQAAKKLELYTPPPPAPRSARKPIEDLDEEKTPSREEIPPEKAEPEVKPVGADDPESPEQAKEPEKPPESEKKAKKATKKAATKKPGKAKKTKKKPPKASEQLSEIDKAFSEVNKELSEAAKELSEVKKPEGEATEGEIPRGLPDPDCLREAVEPESVEFIPGPEFLEALKGKDIEERSIDPETVVTPPPVDVVDVEVESPDRASTPLEAAIFEASEGKKGDKKAKDQKAKSAKKKKKKAPSKKKEGPTKKPAAKKVDEEKKDRADEDQKVPIEPDQPDLVDTPQKTPAIEAAEEEPIEVGLSDAEEEIPITVDNVAESIEELRKKERISFLPDVAKTSGETSVKPKKVDVDGPVTGLPSVIVDMGEDIEGLVIKALKEGDEADRAAQELLDMGEEGLPSLVRRFPGEVLLDWENLSLPVPPPEKHGRLLGILKEFGSSIVPYLAPKVYSADRSKRYYATLLLGHVEDREALAVVGQRLLDYDARIATLAASIVTKVIPQQKLPLPVYQAIRAALSDRHTPEIIVHRAAEAAGILRDRGSVPALIELLRHSQGIRRQAARLSLRLITGHDFGTSTRRWASWWTGSAEKHRIEWLIEALDDKQEQARAIASRELSLLIPEDFGFDADGPKKQRDEIRQKYVKWWKSKGQKMFKKRD